MGAFKSKHKSLPQKELRKLIEESHCTFYFNSSVNPMTVTQSEILQLFEHFKTISSSLQNDGVIDVEEFKKALGLKDGVLAERLFRVFDNNNDKLITFAEFVSGFSILGPRGTLEEKLDFSFKLYDMDGDGFIDKEELYNMLKATVFGMAGIQLSDGQMKALVDNTFSEVDVNKDGKISFEEYKTMALKHPKIVENLTISTSPILSS